MVRARRSTHTVDTPSFGPRELADRNTYGLVIHGSRLRRGPTRTAKHRALSGKRKVRATSWRTSIQTGSHGTLTVTSENMTRAKIAPATAASTSGDGVHGRPSRCVA